MREGLNILDALENLNTLNDAASIEEIEVTQEARLIPHKGEDEDRYWVRAGSDEHTQYVIKETFRTVHTYLQSFYKQMKASGDTAKLVEGVNTIMVLVGEAATRLDRFGVLFKERVTEFPEYRDLQEFYRSKVIKEAFRDFAHKPIAQKKKEEGHVLPEQEEWEAERQALLQETETVEEISGVHILNDIDVIKRDHLYELFYLKNEAGHDFYTFQLARNLKLACDFGEFAEEYFGDDPLLQIKNWEDRWLHLFAGKILSNNTRIIERFYGQAMRYKEMDLIASVHNALMALMLAANPRNLIRQFAIKGCHHYFRDFLFFLREALENREYQKFVIYSPPPGQPFFQDVLDLIQGISRTLFLEGPEQDELRGALKHLIERVDASHHKELSKSLAQANHALTEVLKRHPSGPVFNALDIVREQEEERAFDPLLQGNSPFGLFSWHHGQKERKVLHMPCPIHQKWIAKAYITNEFKTFLSTFKRGERLLVFNFQDRTSWKEHARASAIEELATQAEYAEILSVVTLSRETDFYHQSGVYAHVETASDFIDHVAQHLLDEATGYHFPQAVRQALFPEFIQGVLTKVHTTFFESKRTLSQQERCDFIEIVYQLIEMKVIEVFDPTYITFMSKDGLDNGDVAAVELLAFQEGSREWSQEEVDRIDAILFGATLMNRERAIHPERFERLHSLVERLEAHPDYAKAFAALFNKECWNWKAKLD